METNSYFIPLLLRHLKLMNVKCTPSELQLVLQSAPSFPSVLSIVQAYTYFGLKATAYRADYFALEKVAIPAVAHIKQDNIDRFILLCRISETKVTYFDASINETIEILKDDFCMIWTGIIVLAEKTENTYLGRTSNRKNIGYSIVFAFVCLILPGLGLRADLQLLLLYYGLLGLKLTGIWFAIGLLRQESKGTYSVFDTFCHISKAFDCRKVVQSKASKILGMVTLADVGFVYFAMGIISLCIGAFSNIAASMLQMLFYLSVCSIPFILFSVLYQRFAVKKWCPLCLGVICVLAIEAVLYFFFPYKTSFWNFIEIAGILLFSLLGSIGILFLTKLYIRNWAGVFNASISALQLKRTSLVVGSVFNSQKIKPQLVNDSLIIGKKEAPVTITTLLNPMCNPCKNIAIEIIKLLESYPSFIQWHIRLDGTNAPEHDILNRPQLYLFELFRQNDNAEVRLDIVKKWFGLQSLPEFSRKYPLNNISQEIMGAYFVHLDNNNELKVEKVPSVWINNRAFPKEYSLGDIPFLLTDISVLLKSTI